MKLELRSATISAPFARNLQSISELNSDNIKLLADNFTGTAQRHKLGYGQNHIHSLRYGLSNIHGLRDRRSDKLSCNLRLCLSFSLSIVYAGLNFISTPQAAASDWGYEQSSPKESSSAGKTQSSSATKKTNESQIHEESAAGLARSIRPSSQPKPGASKSPVQIQSERTFVKSTKKQNNGSPGSASAPASKTTAGKAAPTDKLYPAAIDSPELMKGGSPQSSSSAIDRALSGSGLAPAKQQQLSRCWLQLFQICARESLDTSGQKRMESYINKRAAASTAESEKLSQILKFWPRLIEDLNKRPELEKHYADLFRALLRLHEKNSGAIKHKLESSPYSCDADLISELLGLERIAVAETPPFTEDSVNAYADMAIFIYEQQHPGKTIDASDNRALLAMKIADKFKEAPEEKDRRAMASFDLSWAKFKIIWYSCDEASKKVLLEKLLKGGADSSLTAKKDPLLELVLSNWPWEARP